MTKKEKALDHEIAAMDVALEQSEELKGVEIPENSENSDDSEISDDSESSNNTDKGEDLLMSLFGNYPSTLESLREDKDFKPGAGTERFMASVEGYARGSGCAQEDLDQSLVMIFSIGRGVRDGNLNLDMLDTVRKGLRHDETLVKEVRAAELRGRNATIEAKMRTKGSDDGLPHIESRNSGRTTATKSRGIFGLAEGAK